MGTISASRQDLSSLVGMMSRWQDASVEVRMILRISSVVAGEKLDSVGVVAEGKTLDGSKILSNVEGIVAQSFVILSSKKFRKDVASADEEIAEGRDLGALRPSRELRDFHNCFGQFWFEEIVLRKNLRFEEVIILQISLH